MLVVLVGGVIVVSGALASYFSVWYQSEQAAKNELTGQLKEAQARIEELEAENAAYRDKEEVMAAMADALEEEEIPEIPFEVDLDDWKYLLVNELNPLAQDYEMELVKTYDGQKVDARMKEPLEAMIDAGAKDGMKLLICSSYRDYKKQNTLMENSIANYVRKGLDYKDAFFKAKDQIALTGTSEHHTGLAVDIVGKGHQSLDRAQADTAEAKWLNEHAHEYGFILRYPEDKEELTMITYESWHFRYVGVEAATYMKENDLCLEEFVELAKTQEKLKEREQTQAQIMNKDDDQARK